MIDNIKEAKCLEELIYTLESLSYYFGLMPMEFWKSTYKEVNLFCQSNLMKLQDDFKRNIILQEAVTNKLIMADSMGNKKPKIVPLQKTFKNLFSKREEK